MFTSTHLSTESYREIYRKYCSDLDLTSSLTSITPNLSYSIIKGGCSRICVIICSVIFDQFQ